MAVSYVGVTSGNSAGGTSTSFATTLPAGWQAGDVAVLSGHVRGTSLTMATPAGWTLLPGPTWPVNQGTNSRAYAWYRVLQAGDTAPTITLSGAMTGGWSMTVYRGAATASPIGQVGTAAVSGTSLALPTLAGVLAGSALAVAVHAGVASGTIPTNITPDAAYTEVADHATSRATTAANQRMEAAYRLAAAAGSYGGESFSTTVTASMVAVLVEVLAAPSGVSGDLAAVLAPLAVSGSGSVQVAGAASAALPPAVGGLSGAATSAGPLAVTLPALGGQHVGSLRSSGSLVASLPAASVDAAGSVAGAPAGSVDASLPAPAAAAAGAVSTSGSLAPTIPALTAELTAATVSTTVQRPDSGVTPRPGGGSTLRPGPGVTNRPAVGTTARPLSGLTVRPSGAA